MEIYFHVEIFLFGQCDGMPDPVCVRQMNTYLSLWKEDKREVMDQVIKRTEEVSCDWRTLLSSDWLVVTRCCR